MLMRLGQSTFSRWETVLIWPRGDNLTHPTYVVQMKPGEVRITGIRLEALTHDSLSGGRLSSGNGNVILTDFTVQRTKAGGGKPQTLKIASAVADYAQSWFSGDTGDRQGQGFRLGGRWSPKEGESDGDLYLRRAGRRERRRHADRTPGTRFQIPASGDRPLSLVGHLHEGSRFPVEARHAG